jgi:F-type H+-transporting ATPase subunit delta
MTQSSSNSKQGSGADSGAMTYAKALLGACTTQGTTTTAVEELDSFVFDVWEKLPKLKELFSSSLISADEKIELIKKALAGKASQVFENFLLVLAKHDRLSILPSVQNAVQILLDHQSGNVRVSVTTADPLEQTQLTQLQQSLTGMLGGKPVLDNKIDPSIIGGLVLRVGDKVYDGSMASQLKRVRQEMVNRSVHEIQSRRDSFSTSERN